MVRSISQKMERRWCPSTPETWRASTCWRKMKWRWFCLGTLLQYPPPTSTNPHTTVDPSFFCLCPFVSHHATGTLVFVLIQYNLGIKCTIWYSTFKNCCFYPFKCDVVQFDDFSGFCWSHHWWGQELRHKSTQTSLLAGYLCAVAVS